MFGRQIRQKAFTLYARNKYGDGDFDFPLFPSKSINSFKRFLLRCSSNDFNRTYIRDAMMNGLVIGQMDVDYQAYQPAMVYMNGVFWGLYNIREKTNQFYPESNYGINRDLVDLVEGIDRTAHGDGAKYQELIQFVTNSDMTLPENYEYVKRQMDIVEFMNYYITEIYVCNRDWLHQNIKCWREHSDNGKWRWLLYDMDWGFSGEVQLGSDQYTDNTVRWVLDQAEASLLFRRLILNDDFKEEFVQRFVTHINLTFSPERVHTVISAMQDQILPEMPRQIERWGAIKSMEYWNEQMTILHLFAENRPFHMYVQLAETLMPEEKRELILEVSNPEAGQVSVYDVPCPVPVYGNLWYRNLPLHITAKANPGWRFVRWVGTHTSENDTLIISLSENAILHAVFEPYELPSIVISEIHYNPSDELQGEDEDFEFIELVNREGSRIDISGFRFNDAIEFTFPTGSYMDAGQNILVVKNAATYFNSGVQVYQVSGGKLDNAGEKLTLTNHLGELIDQVHFDDHYPWPRKPDGDGPSLELLDPSLDNNLATSWKASEDVGGTPGTSPFPEVYVNGPQADKNQQITVWPNPFMSNVNIEYSLNEEARVIVDVFNSTGQQVGQLASQTQKPGQHRISWEPMNLMPGLYFLHIQVGSDSQTAKVIYSGSPFIK
jgi:hypothetical protein